jgi:hypothetical protein
MTATVRRRKYLSVASNIFVYLLALLTPQEAAKLIPEALEAVFTEEEASSIQVVVESSKIIPQNPQEIVKKSLS